MQKSIYRVIDPKKNDGHKYEILEEINYLSERYGQMVRVPRYRTSDGATGAKDLPESISWWVHDEMCLTGKWHDGTKCSPWQASMVLKDILKEEGYTRRQYTWKWATFFWTSLGWNKKGS